MAKTVRVVGNGVLGISLGGPTETHIDFSKVQMSDAQRQIMAKLLDKLKAEGTVDVSDDAACEAGQCPASRHLSNDEFNKIRGLKATLGTQGPEAGLIADSCLHVVIV